MCAYDAMTDCHGGMGESFRSNKGVLFVKHLTNYYNNVFQLMQAFLYTFHKIVILGTIIPLLLIDVFTKKQARLKRLTCFFSLHY